MSIHFYQIIETYFSSEYNGGLESIDFIRFKRAQFGSCAFEEWLSILVFHVKLVRLTVTKEKTDRKIQLILSLSF